MDRDVGPGHNLPSEFETLMSKADERIAGANRFLTEVDEIPDTETADKAQGFVEQLRGTWKEMETARKAEKKPHQDAGKAVDAQYKTPLTMLEAAANAVKSKLTAFLKAEQARVDAEARRQAEEARKAQEDAERKAREAAESATPIQAQVAAEEAAENAKQAQEDADRAANTRATARHESGTRSMSLRTTYFGVIEDWTKVRSRYRDDPRVKELYQKLVDDEIRHSDELKNGKKTIPGVRVDKEEKAA